MDAKPHTITGRCLCGAVSYEATLATLNVGICHCGMCRRQASSPMMFVDFTDKPVFTGAENITDYRSSDWGFRGFCKVCGSQLYWRFADKDSYSMTAGTLDDVSILKLDREIYIEDQPAFYAFVPGARRLTAEQANAEYAMPETP